MEDPLPNKLFSFNFRPTKHFMNLISLDQHFLRIQKKDRNKNLLQIHSQDSKMHTHGSVCEENSSREMKV
jgi:hypothetical protein